MVELREGGGEEGDDKVVQEGGEGRHGQSGKADVHSSRRDGEDNRDSDSRAKDEAMNGLNGHPEKTWAPAETSHTPSIPQTPQARGQHARTAVAFDLSSPDGDGEGEEGHDDAQKTTAETADDERDWVSLTSATVTPALTPRELPKAKRRLPEVEKARAAVVVPAGEKTFRLSSAASQGKRRSFDLAGNRQASSSGRRQVSSSSTSTVRRLPSTTSLQSQESHYALKGLLPHPTAAAPAVLTLDHAGGANPDLRHVSTSSSSSLAHRDSSRRLTPRAVSFQAGAFLDRTEQRRGYEAVHSLDRSPPQFAQETIKSEFLPRRDDKSGASSASLTSLASKSFDDGQSSPSSLGKRGGARSGPLSRTQQKLLMQRTHALAVDDEKHAEDDAQSEESHPSALSRIVAREAERLARELNVVRQFRDPMHESLSRAWFVSNPNAFSSIGMLPPGSALVGPGAKSIQRPAMQDDSRDTDPHQVAVRLARQIAHAGGAVLLRGASFVDPLPKAESPVRRKEESSEPGESKGTARSGRRTNGRVQVQSSAEDTGQHRGRSRDRARDASSHGGGGGSSDRSRSRNIRDRSSSARAPGGGGGGGTGETTRLDAREALSRSIGKNKLSRPGGPVRKDSTAAARADARAHGSRLPSDRRAHAGGAGTGTSPPLSIRRNESTSSLLSHLVTEPISRVWSRTGLSRMAEREE